MAEYILLLSIPPTRGVLRVGYYDQRALQVGDVIPEDRTRPKTLRHRGVDEWRVDGIEPGGIVRCLPAAKAADSAAA